MNLKRIENAVKEILLAVGEDPQREGLKDTPKRVAKMYSEIFSGLGKDPRRVFKVFKTEGHEEMVLLKDIPFYSMCEHHLLPFVGKAHVAYIPAKGRLSGLSKLARVVDLLARRPQVQERLTGQVADAIMAELSPRGALVVVEAEHLCMTMRGVNKAGSKMVTSAVRGIFETSDVTRKEALTLISKRSE
ncbi:MAG: GTP cyclohydrolase I FolE [candidate division FCPU426 bacterium]